VVEVEGVGCTASRERAHVVEVGGVGCTAPRYHQQFAPGEIGVREKTSDWHGWGTGGRNEKTCESDHWAWEGRWVGTAYDFLSERGQCVARMSKPVMRQSASDVANWLAI
jgi:hypothetical protein